MTQKRNHYNVKLLRGYGISINLKNNHLVLKNGQNDITGIPSERIVSYPADIGISFGQKIRELFKRKSNTGRFQKI